MSMRHALHAEWTKLRTTKGTFWLLLTAIVVTIGVSVAATATFKCPSGTCAMDPVKISLTGVQIGQAVVAILAVLAISGEYSTGMIRSTLTAIPQRAKALAAKAILLLAMVLPTAAVAVFASVSSLDNSLGWRAAAGSVIYLGLIALLSLGIATAVRDSASAIGIVLGLLYVFPIIASMANDPDWQRHLQQIGPTSAGLAIQATVGLKDLPIGPWAGLGVLALWALGALVLGGVVFKLRDA